jgi:hypothetical protein
MRKVWLEGVMLSALAFCSTCVQAQSNPNIYEPDRGRLQVGVNYQYQQYDVLGRRFHTHGFNTDFSAHIFDWITGASSRVAVAAEGTAVAGFGHTGGVPSLTADSLFLGAGPHVSIESAGRIEPWIHVLPGWQHFRFTQTANLGSNSAFGFMAGGGLDFRLVGPWYWRVQADYIGTHYRSSLQSNYSVGSGVAFYF